MHRVVLVITIFCLILLVSCGGGGGPEAELRTFVNLWPQGDYQAMYQLLSQEAQEEIDLDTFQTRYANISQGIGLNALKINILNTEIQGKKANLEYTLEFKTSTVDQFSLTYKAEMIQEGQGWRLNWLHEHIFPDLQPQHRVRVNRTFSVRGSILDRHGSELAATGTIREVGLVPGRIQERDEAIAALAPLLGISPTTITSALGQSWVREDTFVPLKKISEDQWQQSRTQLLAIPGVLVQQAPGRVYNIPQGLAQTVGYVAEISKEQLDVLRPQGFRPGDQVGQQGLEAVYQRELAGSHGFAIILVDDKNNQVGVIAEKPAEPGKDITTSLDLALCFSLEQSLQDHQGSAVVLDPHTGQIMGLVSLPGFNSTWFSLGITSQQYRQLTEDKALNNKALAAFPPGSAFKPFTALMGLEEGELNPDYGWETPLIWQPGPEWGNYFVQRVSRPLGLRLINLEQALVWSDNVYFAELALRIGREPFQTYIRSMGFNQDLGLVINSSKSSLGEIESDISLADSSYGQGKMLVSPLHLALMYSALARGDGLIPAPGLLLEHDFQEWAKTGFGIEALNLVDSFLAQVAGNPGSMGYLPVPGYRGKTGTAEISKSRQLAWYACYTGDHVLVVMLEGDNSGFFSREAVAVAREIVNRGID